MGQGNTVAAGALALVMGMSTASYAKQVTLTGNEGVNKIAGELVEFDGSSFIIDTIMGRLSIAASGVTCEGAGCPVIEDPDIMMVGSDTIGAGVMPLLLAGFADLKQAAVEVDRERKEVFAASLIDNGGFGDRIAKFAIKSSTSREAFRALQETATQIGMASRRIEPAEARAIARAGGGNMIDPAQEHVIAVDAIVPIVNPKNPISEVSLDDLDRIYSGQITNWSDLGGKDAPINVYGRAEGSGTGEIFAERIFAASGRRMAAGVTRVASNADMTRAVNSDENAIGFVGYAFQHGSKPLNLSSECGITAQADPFTVKAEEYPLQRRLYFYNRADNLTDGTREFLDFATSAKTDDVIEKSGFVSLAVDRDPRKFQGERTFDLIRNTVNPEEIPLMREMVVEILNYDRLSTTFRFASGSSTLESKALGDLDRLIDYVNQLPGDVEISFVGFSDSDGSFEDNQALSVGRAQRVADAVTAYAAGRVSDRVKFTAKGFGELSPAACNTSLLGKQTNRRVEVWIRRQ
jgi:phosphate transport system substrate-binding protein